MDAVALVVQPVDVDRRAARVHELDLGDREPVDRPSLRDVAVRVDDRRARRNLDDPEEQRRSPEREHAEHAALPTIDPLEPDPHPQSPPAPTLLLSIEISRDFSVSMRNNGQGPMTEILTRPGLEPYVPRLVRTWDGVRGAVDAIEVDGTLVSVDLSGFTALSERLAAKGRAGAEELILLISGVYEGLIGIAARRGGDVLKFRGDALLIFFEDEDHAVRACVAAGEMQWLIEKTGRTRSSVGQVELTMAVGIVSGPCHFFLSGLSHRELVIAGPAATATLQLEDAAEAHEILVSKATARTLDAGWLARRARRGGAAAARAPPTGAGRARAGRRAVVRRGSGRVRPDPVAARAVRGHSRSRAPAGDRGVRQVHRRRPGARARRAGQPQRAAAAARRGRRPHRRRARDHVARVRHRRRRRQGLPHGRRARDAGRRRGADAAGASGDRRRGLRPDAARRRQPRARVRGRDRRSEQAHVRGHGRHGQPRRPARRPREARPDPRHR